MCGIVGYIGTNDAAPILLEGLAKLEYRGYDSAGIAVRDECAEKTQIVKVKGRLKGLAAKTDGGHTLKGSAGIGHTRWATHGEPNENNAHPHHSDDYQVVLVHNGIIENYLELKDKLCKNGYEFYSATDTEVACKLIHYYDQKTEGDHLEAIIRAMLRMRGSYALGILFSDRPEELYAVRKDSPLILGRSEHGSFLASDVPAVLKYVNSVYHMENMEIAIVKKDDVQFFNMDQEVIEKFPTEISWDPEAAEKGGYEHFMMKEIRQQPKAVEDTLKAYIKDHKVVLDEMGLTSDKLSGLERIYMVACGSSYHVGIVAKYVLEELAAIPVEVDWASEFRYRKPILADHSLVVVISQSGETADSLAALRLAKNMGVETLGIVNVTGSAIAREADYCMYTYAGPEISVATTKAYSAQLAAVYLLGIKLARIRNRVSEIEFEALVKELERLPGKIEEILEEKEVIQWLGDKYANIKDAFYMGRGLDCGTCMEGTLKLKEISYVHSESYAAGELKHGTISLIEEGTLVIAVLTEEELYEKMMSNVAEVKSRGAYILGVTNYGNYSIENIADMVIYIPKTTKYFTPGLAIIPLQLLAYYVSVAKGLDVDKPRNLAKSVTVE